MASLFYKTLKKVCTVSLNFYFRKWQVNGRENIPGGPVIFVPNHQNAFLDAVIVACSSKKNPWFLTRANVFNKPFAAWILNKLQMLPVYRFRDGFATLKKNEEVLDNLVKMLNNGKSILIFAEGNHNDQYNLRPLQKGVARIILDTDPKQNVAIIPVGMQYDSRTDFHSRMLVNFGKPIYINKLNLANENVKDQTEIILNVLRESLQPLMLHIDESGYDEKYRHLLKYRQYHDDLFDQLASDQAIIRGYPTPGTVSNFPFKLSVFRNIIMWYARINNLILITLFKNIILKNLGDPQFSGSVKFAVGMFLAPFFWLIQALLLYFLTGSLVIASVYFVSIPLSIKFS